MQVRVAGLPWFEEDDYEAMRVLLPDRSWHATFALWRDAAEQTLQHLERQGTVTVKAYVRSDTFPGWCNGRGLRVDAAALTAYANEVAFRSLQGDELH